MSFVGNPYSRGVLGTERDQRDSRPTQKRDGSDAGPRFGVGPLCRCSQNRRPTRDVYINTSPFSVSFQEQMARRGKRSTPSKDKGMKNGANPMHVKGATSPASRCFGVFIVVRQCIR